jgi:hypothetical protein
LSPPLVATRDYDPVGETRREQRCDALANDAATTHDENVAPVRHDQSLNRGGRQDQSDAAPHWTIFCPMYGFSTASSSWTHFL